MPEPTQVPQSTSSYVVDAENVAEMARLTRQARVLSEHLGLYPQQLVLEQHAHILDIGCGPGEWTLEIAQRFPGSMVTGIDSSNLMITYARSTAESLHIPNVKFEVLDARQPLDFPANSFNFINARFIVGFMNTALWPKVIGECFRLLCPGGIFCSSEPESLGSTTSLALAQYNLMITQAMRLGGQCFTPFGEQYGISAVQHRLLEEAGFQQVQQEVSLINFSAGMPAHSATYDNFKTFLRLLQPLVLRYGLTTPENIEALYASTLEEMAADDFCAVAFFQRTWGTKPM